MRQIQGKDATSGGAVDIEATGNALHTANQTPPANNNTRGTVAPEHSTTLTAAYGDASSGWISKAVDVQKYTVLELVFDYGNHSSASSLTLLPKTGDSGASGAGAVHPLQKVASDGTLSDDELVKTVSGNTTFAVTMDVRGISRLRIAAKVDNATGNPTLSMSYNGHHETDETISPAVA